MNNTYQQKVYILEGLGCANCAAKMEAKIQQLPEIRSANLTFATKQLKIEAADPDAVAPQLESICQSIEDTVTLVAKDAAKAPARIQGKGFLKQHGVDLLPIVLGAVLFAAGIILENMGLFSSLLLPIFLVSYLILGGRVLLTAGKNILRGQIFDENFLMSIATIAAFCIGDFAEGAGVMLFYRIGEFFEHVAVEKSRTQIMEAVDLRPETVALVAGSGEGEHHGHCGHSEHEHHDDSCSCGHDHPQHHDDHPHDHHDDHEDIRIIPAEEAKPGDVLLVRPGDRIPLDGIVTEGESRIDTSPVTGEPVPVAAVPGTEVISGCVNTQGLLKIKVTKPLCESMVTRILDSVENAAAGKPKIDKFITKFAKIYTPIVVALAVLTAIVPSLITGQWSFWITTAITFLVISCPCALVISVPLAFFAGIGAASKLGILFKGGVSIEALKNVKAVVMDKTGTITKGDFTVQQILPALQNSAENGENSSAEKAISHENTLLAIAAACEANSTHPIAASIMETAQQRNLLIQKPQSVEEFPGMGIRAVLADGTALCGNEALMKHFGIGMGLTGESAELSSAGTKVYLALDRTYMGTITISDTIKPDAVSAISSIKAMNLSPAMLTGDTLAGAEAVAAKTGIERIRAQLMPEDKLTALQELRTELGPVLFVGDGINDAPVLAGADVGAAMGTGADAAIEAADVVFMNPAVAAIPQAIGIARRTGAIAMQNIIFALAVKLLVILLGFVGFANIWAAIFADTGVAMLCILNSLRLLFSSPSNS